MKRIMSLTREDMTLAALGAAWIGMWGAWIPHVAISLSQNVFYLAEWATFLTDVRYGNLKFAPDILRLSASLAVLALMMCANTIHNHGARWALRVVIAAPIIFVLMPPYPDVFQVWWSPSYGLRFVTAIIPIAGFAAVAASDRAVTAIRRRIEIVTCLCAIGSAVGGFLLLLSPFQAHYATSLLPGWGMMVFNAGLIAALGYQLSVRASESNQA